MKQFYATMGAVVALLFSSFGAQALTVEEICGTYNAKDIDFSANYNAFMLGTFSGSSAYNIDMNAISWTMTISQVEGNKVKLTQFIKKYITNGKSSPNVDFDIEGEFDPATNTITIQPANYEYPSGFPNISIKTTIAKHDGTSLRSYSEGYKAAGAFDTFKAKFDSKKRLTVEAWAMYDTNSYQCVCIPAYGEDPDYIDGTYFTYAGASGIDDVVAEEDAPVEYYTLQGVRVAEPTPGLYIRRQGSKVSKVVIR